MRQLLVFAYMLFICMHGGIRAGAQAPPSTGQPPIPPALRAQAGNWLRNDKNGFTENKGQLYDQHGQPNSGLKYLYRAQGLNVQLRATGFSYDAWLDKQEKSSTKQVRKASEGKAVALPRQYHRVDIELEGANPDARMLAEQPLAEVANVFNSLGRFDAIRSYYKITYLDMYPGIDLEFLARAGTDKPVEYNFIVHPGADASQIKMRYSNGNDISLKEGMIEMQLAFGTLKEKIPLSYTQQDGHSLAVHYKPLDEAGNLYAFQVPDYDHRKTLVIDPTPNLVWSTFYGGSVNDYIFSLDIDASGNIYAGGYSNSPNNIATAGAYQTTVTGGQDAFVAKFTAAGQRLWGTYIGGANNENGYAVKTDGTSVYLAGSTDSSGTNFAFSGHQNTYGGGSNDGFLAKFNAANGTRVWSTYYGGTGQDNFTSLFLAPDGSLFAGGYTYSANAANVIATAGALQTALSGAGSMDAMLVKFNSAGVRQWGTYVGAAGGDDNIQSVVLDASGNIYVGGSTASTAGIATTGAFQEVFAGGTTDMWIAKLNSTGTSKLWGTYWGGTSQEVISTLKIGPDGNLVAAGASAFTSTGMGSAGTYQPAAALGSDIVIGKFSPSGSRIWATYYGGTAGDYMQRGGMDLDENGNILFFGYSFPSVGSPPSSGRSTNCSYQPDQMGLNETFITKLSADGTTRLWGTYFGSAGTEYAYPLKYAGNGEFVIAGQTNGTTLATAGAFQTVKGNISDAFIARFSEGMTPQDVQVTASTLSPMSQTSCALGIPSMITGNAVSLYNPPGYTSPIFYQWQVANAATGPWTDMSGEVFKDLQPLASQTTKYYRRLTLLNNGYCDKKIVDSSAAATVTINGNTAPIANADGPQWYVCSTGANTVTLNGSATGGSGTYSSYQWYAGSNLTTPVASTAAYTPTVTSTTTYTLKVTDNVGCIDVDQVTVVPVVANAGPDVSMCENGGGIQIGTAGIPGGSVAYSWATVSGSPVSSLSCANCAQPIASPTVTTTYQLTTTVTRKGGATCTTTDNVIVTFVTAPTGGASFGGTDKTICKNSTVVLGGANDASATYNWSPTSYLSASNIYNPTFNAGTNPVSCPMTYTVTATKGGCTFTDQVSVNVIDAATSLDNQTVSCQGWSSGNTYNCSGATYSWQLVSGPGVVPTGASLGNGGADAYLVNTGGTNAVYQRTTTMNGVNCTSGPVTISPCGGGGGCPVISIQTLTPQGCPKVFGQQDLQLYVSGVNAADYYFSWTPAGIMDNPAAPVVTITSTAATTVNLTITNKYTGQTCTAPGLPINNPAWSLPVLNVSGKATCPGTPISIGEPTVTGFSYNWSPATGLNSATVANPVASLNTSATYTVTKTDDNNGCKSTKTVAVNVSGINYDAGPSHAVCNGATVTLGTTPGGSYTYSWTPVNAAWTNGTGPTDANPQALFAGSSQTFNVTVTDPLTGCQKTDTVTLTGIITPGEYAGPTVGPLCPGATAQLGTAAVPNASYSWSPATGLSCTTCANPVATAGTANQAYSVTVSYPGCSTPVTDNVTVSVNSLPAVTLTNKTICPTTPTNIGIGGTGNTASLANVSSYSWTPATNLSCTSCASPNANPVTTTTYTVLITFTNGCTLQKSVTITPTVQATAKPDATICPGSSVVLGSPAVSNVSYAWTVQSGTAGSVNPTNAAQPTANPIATSVYRLTATGTGPNAGCTVTDDVQITVKTLPAFSITGNTSVCAGGSISLSVNPVTSNIIYQWSPATGVASPDSFTTTITPSTTTTYRVTQTDLNSGCSDYKEAVVTVWPNNVTATGGSITVCPASATTMPLTVTPASGNTIVWSPATYLSNPYAQNPVIAPQAGGSYIATVTNTTSNCSDTALVTVIVPTTCTGSDYGDAPAVYENGNPASHGVTSLLRIGASTDAEGAPASAIMNDPAIGDDDNNTINDEEGISFLPGVNTASKTVGVLVNSVLNNTGAPAYLVAWIDFNRDGDFNDAGERSSVLTLASSATAANPVLQFNGFNTGCVVTSGPSYLRARLTTDTSGGWNTTPSSNGTRSNGEVEDYAITIYGNDFSDAPLMYPTASATVNPDLNNDGRPDATGSVWLGNIVDYASCDAVLSNLADGDDNNGMSDEDGLNMHGGIATGNTTATWDLTVNSQGPVNNVQWGIWVDWNADGVFDSFFHNSVNTASPVIVPVTVTSPASIAPNYVVRAGVKTGAAFATDQYNLRIGNGEWEDFIAAPIPLNVTLLSFTATKKTATAALLEWKTAHEEQSDHFIVERSGDARTWSEAGRVKAAVKSETELNYSLTDYEPLNGINYYRLRMVNKDGSYKLSSVQQLSFGDNAGMVMIMPNPAHDIATVVFNKPTEETLTMKLIDGFGRVVTTYGIPAGAVRYTLPLETLPRSIYYLDIKGNTILAHLKLVVQ